MNTEGLAFDWVPGFKEKWERHPALKEVRGNPAQRILESCASVDEAIRFFESHWDLREIGMQRNKKPRALTRAMKRF